MVQTRSRGHRIALGIEQYIPPCRPLSGAAAAPTAAATHAAGRPRPTKPNLERGLTLVSGRSTHTGETEAPRSSRSPAKQSRRISTSTRNKATSLRSRQTTPQRRCISHQAPLANRAKRPRKRARLAQALSSQGCCFFSRATRLCCGSRTRRLRIIAGSGSQEHGRVLHVSVGRKTRHTCRHQPQ